MANGNDDREQIPDLVVGIDFGMTGTAVAYAKPTENVVSVIRKWPNSPGEEAKVPTAISYKQNMQVVSSWGFQVANEHLRRATGIRTRFKGIFDARDLREANRDMSTNIDLADVNQWVIDYLKKVHSHIQRQLKGQFHNREWSTLNVQYIFSHPVTWNLDTVLRFEKAISESGFKLATSRRKNQVSINEAEAAMAQYFVASKRPAVGQSLLVADVGGGTSDVSIFQVEEYRATKPKLRVRVSDSGYNIGATKIDEGFEAEVKRRLKKLLQPRVPEMDQDSLDAFIELQTHSMLARDQTFRAKKHDYGAALDDIEPYFEIPLAPTEKLAYDLSLPEQDIHNGMMRFETKALFEPLFQGICSAVWVQIKEQIDQFHQLEPGSVIDFVVLTGGIGSSTYLRRFLEDRFREELEMTPVFPTVEQPQLAVCMGLVEHTLRDIHQEGVFQYEAKSSYGITTSDELTAATWFIQKDQTIQHRRLLTLAQTVPFKDNRVEICIVKTMENFELKRRWERGGKNKNKRPLTIPASIVESLNDSIKNNELSLVKALPLTKLKLPMVDIAIKIELDRGMIATTIYQKDKIVGGPVYTPENWHSVAMVTDEDSPRGAPPKPSGIGERKNFNWNKLMTGEGIAGLGAAIINPLVQMWKDDKKIASEEKDEDKTEEKVEKEETTTEVLPSEKEEPVNVTQEREPMENVI